jgi:hypothetical protein
VGGAVLGFGRRCTGRCVLSRRLIYDPERVR